MAKARDPLARRSLADPEVQQDPSAWHHALHEAPLHYDKRLGFHVCSSYDQMRRILRDTDTFSSVGSQTMDAFRPPPSEVAALRAQGLSPVNTLVTNDPPSHTRFRKLVDPAFRPRSVDAMRASIQGIVRSTIDEFIDDGACEVVAQLAIPVPIRVIADMLGLDRSLAPKMKEWSDAAVEPLGMMVSDERLIACARLVVEFQEFMAAELETRRAHPRSDLLTTLVMARDEHGAPMTLAEMLSLTQQILVAGNETTTNAIAAGVRLLIDHPDQLAALEAEPTTSSLRRFADEVLRLESPVQGLFRVVRRDVNVDGVELRAGARVMLRFAAANRDPTQFELPDELDPARANAGTHLAFGAGIHHCLGANLAREEMVQTFAVLLERVRGLAFAPGNDFAHHPSMILRGLARLWIRFERR